VTNKQLPYAYAKQHRVLLEAHGKKTRAIYEQGKLSAIVAAELRRFCETEITLTSADSQLFQEKLAFCYESKAGTAEAAMVDLEKTSDLTQLLSVMPKVDDLLESQDDAPIIRLLNAVLAQAIQQQASDVHFELFNQQFNIRLRCDGVLHEILSPKPALAPLIISRIKIMAKLDIAEKRLPQDGRMLLSIGGHDVDVRVSTLPTQHGERIVLRILDKKSVPLDLNKLGLDTKKLQTIQRLIRKPHGILLVTGPTGSGKTTTLYASLATINSPMHNIMTVEDPIEYDLDGVGQTQVNSKIGLSFARGLRAILRQDPDVVMVGEIRDRETADMAVQASLTGHLVLSTLHTNTAIGAITRLRDMGIESFLIASTLSGVVAQRLVRRLCNHCKQRKIATAAMHRCLNIPLEKEFIIYEPVGCEHCRDGYSGRFALYEIVEITPAVTQLIHDEAAEPKLEQAVREQFPSIRHDATKHTLLGNTSIEEFLRVIQD
jgi:general secretion pathway protein E